MLRPRPLPPVPAETARIAHAAFPKGHPSLAAADALGAVFTDANFAALFPRRGQSAFTPWRLALATVLQCAEGRSDRQAADAVRARLDWQYVLRLDLDDAGFAAGVLCAFRGRLSDGEAEGVLCAAVLAWARTRQLLKVRGRQRRGTRARLLMTPFTDASPVDGRGQATPRHETWPTHIGTHLQQHSVAELRNVREMVSWAGVG